MTSSQHVRFKLPARHARTAIEAGWSPSKRVCCCQRSADSRSPEALHRLPCRSRFSVVQWDIASHSDCEVGRALPTALLSLTAVNHQKARAIFLDPGEGDARALEELRAAFLRDPVPGVTLPSCRHNGVEFQQTRKPISLE